MEEPDFKIPMDELGHYIWCARKLNQPGLVKFASNKGRENFLGKMLVTFLLRYDVIQPQDLKIYVEMLTNYVNGPSIRNIHS